MRRIILVLAALVGLTSQSFAANSTVSAMTAASAFGGSELLYIVQGAADRKGTPAQMATYVYSLASGDCTISSAGAVVCTKTNGTAFSALATTTPGTGIATFLTTPSSANLLATLTTKTGTGNAVFGSAPTIDSLNATTAATLAFITGSTQCLQVNTSGAISGTGAACGGSGSTGANPTATASDTAVNGVATTFMRSDAAPAIQKTSASVFGLAKVDGTTILANSGVISAQPGVTSRTVTTTTDTILSTDRGNVVYYNSASAVAITQPAPSGSFAAGFFTTLCNINAGLGTITPGSGTIGGASTFPLLTGTAASPKCITYQSDGTNFNAVSPNATVTIAQGTAAMGTSAIASGACATVVTVSAPGVATTDVMQFGYNGDPTAVTGYGASASGAVLSVYPYPSANNVNVKVCNSSSGSITPGSLTLNWKVTR